MEDNISNDINSRIALRQCDYENIKKLNNEVFVLLLGFSGIVKSILDNIYKECGSFNSLGRANENLKTMNALFLKNYKKIEIIINWHKEEKLVEYSNGNQEIIRYYLNDVYSVITNPISPQKFTLKKYSKKILMKLGDQKYRKQFINERAKVIRKLDKLEANFNIIHN